MIEAHFVGCGYLCSDEIDGVIKLLQR
jgi:hypothetical protein